MEPSTEQIYLREIATQVENAFVYVKRMNRMLDEVGEPSSEVSTSDFFREARGFLQSASSVSRMLWPPRGAGKTGQQRAEHLKSVLDIGEDNILADRELRNHLVHYDERLDAWASDASSAYVANNIGPPPGEVVEGMDFEDKQIFTNYLPAEKALIFWGERYDVQAVADALDDLGDRVEDRLSEVSIEPPLVG